MVSRLHFQSNEKDFRKHDLWVIWIGLGWISENMGLCIMGEKCSGVTSFWVNMGQNNKKERKTIMRSEIWEKDGSWPWSNLDEFKRENAKWAGHKNRSFAGP